MNWLLDSSYSQARKNLGISYNNYGLVVHNSNPQESLHYFAKALYLDSDNKTTLGNFEGAVQAIFSRSPDARDYVELARKNLNDSKLSQPLAFDTALVEYCFAAKCASKDEYELFSILPAIQALTHNEQFKDRNIDGILKIAGETRKSLSENKQRLFPTDLLKWAETTLLGFGAFILLVCWIPAANKQKLYTWILLTCALPLIGVGAWLTQTLGDQIIACNSSLINWYSASLLVALSALLSLVCYFMPAVISIKLRNKVAPVIVLNLLSFVFIVVLYPIALFLACFKMEAKVGQNDDFR